MQEVHKPLAIVGGSSAECTEMRCLLVAAVALAGCGAQLSEDGPSDGGTGDGPRLQLDGGLDASPDAPPDARPCTGTPDPTTGTCLVFRAGPVTYAEATTACDAMAAKLVVIKSAQTNATVRSLLGQLDAFVGATDLAVEGTFRWLGNAADPVTGYTNWRSGEPNNGGANSTIQEDCMIIEGDQDGTWDDRPCDASEVPTAGRYAYVCQY